MEDSHRINIDEVEADNLVDIEANPRLKVILPEWQSRFRLARDRVDTKRTRSINVKNELYQLIGFYSVFQGVVLTAVAQASTVKCHTSWGPASLSAMASIATLFSVHNKFRDYNSLISDMNKEQNDAKVLKEKIDQLKLQGGNFDFAKHAPDVPKKKDTENRNKKTWPKERYQWPVMFFLFLFSFIVCSCCIIIMCWQHIDKFGDT